LSGLDQAIAAVGKDLLAATSSADDVAKRCAELSTLLEQQHDPGRAPSRSSIGWLAGCGECPCRSPWSSA
jgi:hypothetical protein